MSRRMRCSSLNQFQRVILSGAGEILFPCAYGMKIAAQSNLCERGSEAKALSVVKRDLLLLPLYPMFFEAKQIQSLPCVKGGGVVRRRRDCKSNIFTKKTTKPFSRSLRTFGSCFWMNSFLFHPKVRLCACALRSG